MRAVVILTICLLAVSLLPISTSVAQENDYLIVAGQRVGKWELGKAVDAYGFGRQGGKWEGTAGGRAYYDGYAYPQPPRGPYLQVYACKNDSLVFAILIVRRLDAVSETDPEELKYKTGDGVRIGMEESEVVRLLGRPDGTSQYTERHGQFEVLVRQLEYRDKGLFVRVNRSDLKAFALGATKEGGFPACQQAVLGSPPAAQPAPGTTPAPAGVPVNVQLPVPMPGDLRIIPPSSDIPANRAAFSGVWVGKWEGFLDTALAVQEITPSGVAAVYSWGVAPQWNIRQSGWSRKQGVFTGATELQLRGDPLIIYRMRPDGRLDAEFQSQQLTRGTLTRVFPPR